MTQALAILRHLKAGQSVTPLEALRDFNCLRLAAVVHDLKRQGYPIRTVMIHADNGKRYARYEF